MTTSGPLLPSADEHHRRMASALHDINARIVRLASALEVSLDTEADIVQAMQEPPHTGASSGHEHAHRADHMRAELRALLVLRYKLHRNYVEDIGLVAVVKLIAEAEEHLHRQGFQHGTDGVNVDDVLRPAGP